MPERITIVVEPSDDHGGFLTVQDAMRQVLDFIEEVTASASDDARPKFEWRLVSASTNSPFTAVAEAVSADPEWPDIDLEAREAKARVSSTLQSVLDSGEFPSWVKKEGRERVRALLRRNMNGIAKTAIVLDESAPQLVLVERRARAALEKIELANAERAVAAIDYPGEELGSIEGNVFETTTHYGKPAVRIRNRLSGDKVLCVLSDEVAEEIGREHNWQEVWTGQRVIVTGKLKRNTKGAVTFATVEKMRAIVPRRVNESALAELSASEDQGPRRDLERLWDGESGED